MNMLNTEMRALVSFTDEEQQEFQRLIGTGKLEFLSATGSWHDRQLDSALAIGGVYRLKLKDGDWYEINTNLVQWRYARQSFFSKYNNKVCSLEEAKDYRKFSPATQAEINSVKPQESFVDVEIESWNKFGEPMFKMKEGFVLSGYVMEDGYHTNTPTKFQENGTVINERAVSVRFVRLEQ